MHKTVAALKNLFIPHEGNGHRPHILRSRIIGIVCLITILAEGVFLFGASYLGPRSSLFGTILVSALTDGTNTARTDNDLPALRVSPLLQAAAQEKADDMVKNGYFAHTSPTGVTPWYWFENVGYSFTYAGENLAVNFSDSQDVTDAWLNSPEHRANIMNTNFTEIGIATAEGTFQGHDAIYVVELFGTPSSFPTVAEQPASPSLPAAKEPLKPNPPVVQAPPTVIATASVTSADSQESFVAVKGASIEASTATVPMAAAQPTASIASPSLPVLPQQTNIVQRLAANPRGALDDLYVFLALFFGFALALNIFIKIRIQYPNLILGGVIVMSLAGLFIILNQQLVASIVIK